MALGDLEIRKADLPIAGAWGFPGRRAQGAHPRKLDPDPDRTEHDLGESHRCPVRRVHVFPYPGGSAYRPNVPRVGYAPWSIAGIFAR